MLLVAHDVNPILGYLDRVVYFAAGPARRRERREEVITSETLSRLYGAPIEVLETSDGRLVVVGQPEAPFVTHPATTMRTELAGLSWNPVADLEQLLASTSWSTRWRPARSSP